MNRNELEYSAAALYDGGWRSYDREQLIRTFNLTEEEAGDLCNELDSMQPKLDKSKHYMIKPEFLFMWGSDANEESVLSYDDVEMIARGTDSTVESLADQLFEVDYPIRWYAVMNDREDTDWGYGSHSKEKALKMLNDCDDYEAYIAVIENDVCIEEIEREYTERIVYVALESDSYGSEDIRVSYDRDDAIEAAEMKYAHLTKSEKIDTVVSVESIKIKTLDWQMAREAYIMYLMNCSYNLENGNCNQLAETIHVCKD